MLCRCVILIDFEKIYYIGIATIVGRFWECIEICCLDLAKMVMVNFI